MKVTFARRGDAFGGGKFNTCFHIKSEGLCFLIDCGAPSMIALKALRLDPDDTETIPITHFHGDHFGGLPYLMLDAQFFSKRRAPLKVVGPPGLKDRFLQVIEM